MVKQVLFVCLLSLIKADDFINDLHRNIKTYRNVYFDYNIRDFPEEAVKNLRRESSEPVRMKISDALLIDENSFENDREKRESSGPVRMKISDALLIDENSFENDREKRESSGPVRMKISDALLIDENSFENDREKRESSGPVRMKISDALLIDENSFENDREKRESSGPVRMKISDALLIDENSFENDREKRESSGPVRMKISDALLIDENSFENDREKRESSGPVRMKISDALLIDENSFENDKEKRESSGPVRMKISDALLIDENSFENDREKRESSGPVRMKISDALLIDENSFENDREKRDSSGPVRMKISDALLIDENSFENDREKRESSGPVRMKISDALLIDENSFENDREKRESSGPVRMKISDALLIDENSFENDRENRESSGPVRMKISDALLIDENSFENDREKRDSSGPVRMKISDALLIDENSFENDREKRESSGPVRMKISDALLIDENSFENDREKRESSGPVRMKISDALLIDENSFENDREKRESSGPVRMKISDALLMDDSKFNNERGTRELPMSAKQNIIDKNNFSNDTKRKSKIDELDRLGVLKSLNMNNTSDENDTQLLSLYMCNNNDKIYEHEWFKVSKILYPAVQTENTAYFTNWQRLAQLFNKDHISRPWFGETFPRMKTRNALKSIGSTAIFQGLFWPFVLKVGFMNQRLGLFGLTGENVPVQIQKMVFYYAVEKLQTIRIPVAEGKVIYSFDNNVDLIDGMNRSGLLENSKEFLSAGHHLFSQDEQKEITRKVDEAMKLIQDTNPELYNAINQLVACFAFYKSENRAHIGGTVSSALGIIWLDPSALSNWSIPFYAEQIVHEFIHTSLFYAELVHGTFTDHRDLSKAKVMSSIRRQLRDYDKSFHAAYVSTGLVAFHSKAGYLNRAEALAKPLISTVGELVKVNKQTGILTESGEAMLQTLVDFLIVARL